MFNQTLNKRSIERLVRRFSRYYPNRRVVKSAYSLFETITDMIVSNDWQKQDYELASIVVDPAIFGSATILCDYYHIPPPKIFDHRQLYFEAGRQVHQASADRYNSYYAEFDRSGAYAAFFDYPDAPASSVIVYDTESILKGEDAKILVPPFARAIFHELFHWLVFYKAVLKFDDNEKVSTLLHKLSDEEPMIGEQAAERYSYHIMKIAGKIA